LLHGEMKMKIKGSGNRAWQPQTGKEIIKRETERERMPLFGCKWKWRSFCEWVSVSSKSN